MSNIMENIQAVKEKPLTCFMENLSKTTEYILPKKSTRTKILAMKNDN